MEIGVNAQDDWHFSEYGYQTSNVYERGSSRGAATSKMECFVIIVNGF